VTKLHLQHSGLVQVATKRLTHRKKRPRWPLIGMMLHQDASTHAWLPGQAGKQDLVVTMDDRPARSIRCSWWTRKARHPACAVSPRWSRHMTCSTRSTPTGAAIVLP